MSYSQDIHPHMEQLGREFQGWYDNWVGVSWTVHNEMMQLGSGGSAAQADPSYIYQALIADLIEKQGLLIEMEAHTRGLLRSIQQQRMQTLPMPPLFNISEPPSIAPPWGQGFNRMIHFSGQPRMQYTLPLSRPPGPPRHSFLPITGGSFIPSASVPNSTAGSTSGSQSSVQMAPTTSGESTSRSKSFLRIEQPQEQSNIDKSTSEPSRHSSASTITPDATPSLENQQVVAEETPQTALITKTGFSVDAEAFVLKKVEAEKPESKIADQRKDKSDLDQIREDAKSDAYFRLEAVKKDASAGATSSEVVDTSHVFADKAKNDGIRGNFFDDNVKNEESDYGGHESRMSTATTATQFYDALSDVEDTDKTEEVLTTPVPSYEASRPSSALTKPAVGGRMRFGRGDSSISSASSTSSSTPVPTRPPTSQSVSDVSAEKESRASSFLSRYAPEVPNVEKETLAEKVYPVFPAAFDVPKTDGFSRSGFGGRMRSDETAPSTNGPPRDDFGARFGRLRTGGESLPNTNGFGSDRATSTNEPEKAKERSPVTSVSSFGSRPRFGLNPEDKKKNSEASTNSVSESRPSSSHSSVFRTESRASNADVGMKITFGQTGRIITNGTASSSSTGGYGNVPKASFEDRHLHTDREISSLQQKTISAVVAYKSSEEQSRPSSRARFGRADVSGEPASGQVRSHTSLDQGDGRGNQVQQPTQALSNYHNGISLSALPDISKEKVYPSFSSAPIPKPPQMATLVFDGPLKKKYAGRDYRPSFEEAGVPNKLIEILGQNGIREPTGLEFDIILAIFQGKQMVVKAPPKSGKTFSFVCAVVSQISLQPPTCIETVIVTETAGQAKSIHDLMMCLGTFYPINYLLCDDRTVTLESTRSVFGAKQVQLVIGTADRLLKVLPENNCGDDRLHSSWTKFQYDVKEKIYVPPIDLNHSSENGRIAEEYSAPSNVSTPSSETLLDLVIDHFSDPAQRHRSHTRQKFGNGSAGAPPTAVIPEQKFVVVRAAVFLDDAMMEQLGKETQHYVHHANYVSLVFSAVNQLFDDGAFGAHRPYVDVVKMIFGTNNTAFFDEDPLNGETGPRTADAEVEHYLRSLCALQPKLKRDAMGEHRSITLDNGSSNWDMFVALTGLDLWVSYQKFARTDHHGEHDDSSQPDSSRVMGVTGVAYEGSACHPDKNCAVIEFTRGIEVVDTITHEIAHMLGIVHDASKNPSHPCYEKRKTIMARDFGNSRKGWSSCSCHSRKNQRGSRKTHDLQQLIIPKPLSSSSRLAKRSVSLPPAQLGYTIDMFGASYVLKLRRSIVASDRLEAVVIAKNGVVSTVSFDQHQTQCHYIGIVTMCRSDRECFQGKAAMSRFAHGLRGIMKIGGEDVLIEPLPETLLAKRMRFSNVHIARKKLAGELFTENESSMMAVMDSLANSLSVPHDLLDLKALRSIPKLITVEVGVFVDSPMVVKLNKTYPRRRDQISLLLAAYNAVNLLYEDATIGKMAVKLRVKRILLDDSSSMPKDEKVTEYLNQLCKSYQPNILKRLKITRDWDLTTALTGLDVYADAVDVTRDAAYRNLRGSAKKIFTVSGVSYGGGMCSEKKNCMVAEFSLIFGNIETIAHEAGHTLGMYHDGSGNSCDRKGNKIMSIQRPQRQRAGWSSCSAQSLQSFVMSGHAWCLTNKLVS